MSTRALKPRRYLQGYGSVVNVLQERRRHPSVTRNFYKGGLSVDEAFLKDWNAIAADLKQATGRALIGHTKAE